LSQGKPFTFNSSSCHLDPSVEGLLRSKGAISVDSEATAYINSGAMPSILLGLIERNRIDTSSNAELVAQLRAEVDRYSTERQKIIEENLKMASQIRSYSLEAATLKDENAVFARSIEVLKAENAHLQTALAPQTAHGDYKLKLSFEKLQKEFQELRAQCAEALTSLKILEDENKELAQELDRLRSQSKNTSAPKAG
jgi:chromosome segregation ATPase